MSLYPLVSVNPVNTGRVFYADVVPVAPDGNTYIPGDFIQFVPYWPTRSAGPNRNPPYGWWCVTGGVGGVATWSTAGFSPQNLTDSGANNAIATAPSAVAPPPLTDALMVTIFLTHSLQAGANTYAYNNGPALPIKSSYNPALDIANAYSSGGFIQLFYHGGVWMDLKQ